MRKKLLAALLSVCIIVSMMVVPASASAFNDVSSDHWAASAIERWAGYEVLNGNGDGTFAPDRQMTRAEFASMLVNMLGLTKKSSTKFPDVPDNAWYADCISIAAAAGIITGDNGNAAPSRPISFNEAAVMLCRALGLAKTNVSGADWAKESIEKLTEMGAIGGSDTHLQAGADCNRAVVAALADKIVEQYVDEDTTITGQVKGVVLVVKGAKADIKDAVLSAPLVIESAEATLTNTTAQDVKVDGTKSAVTTDAKSSVAEVILGGEAPKADIKGTATSVTVAENATSAVVDAPASVEVKNESSSAITVNGETQEPAKTDDDSNTTTTTTEVTQGTSNPAHTHQWVYEQTTEMNHRKYCAICKEGYDTVVPCGTNNYTYVGLSTSKHKVVCTLCGATTEGDHELGENGTCACGYGVTINDGNASDLPEGQHTHNFVVDQENSTAATCTTAGKIVYKCTAPIAAAPAEGDGQQGQAEGDTPCTATKTEIMPATGHTYVDTGVTKAATCISTGTQQTKCSGCGALSSRVLPIDTTSGHNYDSTTWKSNGNGYHGHPCTLCGALQSEDTACAAADGATTSYDATNHWQVCEKCGGQVGKNEHATWEACGQPGVTKCTGCDYKKRCEHVWENDQDTTCDQCDMTRTVTTPDEGGDDEEGETPPESHQHNYTYEAAQVTESVGNYTATHTGTCSVDGCSETTTVNCTKTWTSTSESTGTCTYCGNGT